MQLAAKLSFPWFYFPDWTEFWNPIRKILLQSRLKRVLSSTPATKNSFPTRLTRLETSRPKSVWEDSTWTTESRTSSSKRTTDRRRSATTRTRSTCKASPSLRRALNVRPKRPAFGPKTRVSDLPSADRPSIRSLSATRTASTRPSRRRRATDLRRKRRKNLPRNSSCKTSFSSCRTTRRQLKISSCCNCWPTWTRWSGAANTFSTSRIVTAHWDPVNLIFLWFNSGHFYWGDIFKILEINYSLQYRFVWNLKKLM